MSSFYFDLIQTQLNPVLSISQKSFSPILKLFYLQNTLENQSQKNKSFLKYAM